MSVTDRVPPPPGPPEIASTASAGAGNHAAPPPKCKTGFVEKHGKCVRKHHKPKPRHQASRQPHG